MRNRINPRISLNKLSEYLTATPVRRKGILREQKQPKPFIVGRYQKAKNLICSHLCGEINDDQIRTMARGLMAQDFTSTWKEENAQLCQEAISAHLSKPYDSHLAPFDSEPDGLVEVGGIQISVWPDLICLDDEGQVTGVLKLHLSKTHQLSKEAGEYGSLVLWRWAEVHFGQTVQRNSCQLYEVFGQQLYTPKKAFKKRLGDITAACEEIAILWPHIEVA